MTNSKKLEGDNISQTNKDIDDLQSKSYNLPVNCCDTNQKSVDSCEGDEITIAKGRKNRKKKKVNSKKIQETAAKLVQNADKVSNKSKKLDSSPKNKENKINNDKKTKVTSPNHKLTEYFSDLRVNDGKNEKNRLTNDVEGNLMIKNETKSTTNAVSTDKQSSAKKPIQINEKKQPRKSKSITKSLNHTIDEYFKVRRSNRRFKKDIDLEKEKQLQMKIVNQVEEGLEVKEFEGKGRGVVSTKEFHKGDFVIEYIGDLIDGATAKQRENQYARNKSIGCYMYYFKHKNSQYCIDATEESGKLGRLINHSKKGNLMSRIIDVEKIPHLVLFAKVDIPINTEVLYDYGDRSKESVQHHPWLNL